MVGIGDVEDAVLRAKELMSARGHECDTTAGEVMRYFAVYPYTADLDLEGVIKCPLLVVHELAEIQSLKRMGIRIDREAILNDPSRVEEAHYQASVLEMELAHSMRDYEHVKMRIGSIRSWLLDERIDNGYKALYAELYARTISMMDELSMDRR